MNSVHILLREIERLGGLLNSPTSDSAITEAEKSLGCQIASDYREYFLHANGTVVDTSRWSWHFFSIDKIRNLQAYRNSTYSLKLENEVISGEKLYTFCDVLIDAPTYVIVGDPNRNDFGSVYSDDTSQGWFVASSFEGFVDIFIEQNNNILLLPKQ